MIRSMGNLPVDTTLDLPLTGRSVRHDNFSPTASMKNAGSADRKIFFSISMKKGLKSIKINMLRLETSMKQRETNVISKKWIKPCYFNALWPKKLYYK